MGPQRGHGPTEETDGRRGGIEPQRGIGPWRVQSIVERIEGRRGDMGF
jgi:hypothetical protein